MNAKIAIRVILMIMLVGIKTTFSQNLVLNSGFEDSVGCPIGMGFINLSNGWFGCNWGTPDYFHPCSPSCGSGTCNGVPQNFAGYQMPYEGNAYAGIVCYDLDFPSFREFF